MEIRFFIARHGLLSILPVVKPEVQSEVYLWRKTIDQALHDTGHKNPRISQEAQDWFCIDNPDFLEVCHMAEINPKALLEIYSTEFKQALIENWDTDRVKGLLSNNNTILKLTRMDIQYG